MAEEKTKRLHLGDIADALYDEAQKEDVNLSLTRKQADFIRTFFESRIIDALTSRQGFQLTGWFTVGDRPKEAADVTDFQSKEARHNPRRIVPKLVAGKKLKEALAAAPLTDADTALLDKKAAKKQG